MRPLVGLRGQRRQLAGPALRGVGCARKRMFALKRANRGCIGRHAWQGLGAGYAVGIGGKCIASAITEEGATHALDAQMIHKI
jgi:hypothetical protein